MRLAIATSKNELPASDEALKTALVEQGIIVSAVLWSSPQVAWQTFDAVVIRSCWDYHLRVNGFLDWITQLEHAGIAVLNSPSLIRWNFNKRYLKELSGHGIRIPKTVWLGPGEEIDLDQVCSSLGWTNAVVKPLVSASAYKTARNRVGIIKGPAMIQEYLTPIETNGEWSLMYFGGCFSHAVRKCPTSGDFRVQVEFGGTVTAAVPQQSMLAFADATIARLPEPATIARIDVLADEDGLVLMEVEVIEPELFLGFAPGSERLAARAVIRSVVGATT
jgi:glutathione synthase/RimK-type ligase-like ATP-grasp enzyme